MRTAESQHKSCIICGSQNLRPLKGYEEHHLGRCITCDFTFSLKMPGETELIEHYEKYGRDDYLSPITISRYSELLKYFENWRSNNRILDVGCGIGYFLEEASKKEWKTYGTEFTADAVEICSQKGIQMELGPLNPSLYDDQFDVITSFEVLEHVNNPIEEVQKMHILLRKGGIVYLTTPNFNSVLRYILKEKYNVISYPEHLSYYTPRTLKLLFEQNGFKLVKMRSEGLSLTRLKTSSGISNESFISSESADEKIRRHIEKNGVLKWTKSLVNFFLSAVGRGDSIKAVFRKI